MSKVATYLRGHILGEVSTRADVREAVSTDTGVLKCTPEMVIYPRNTNDIRKVARFSWQLAEKGHALPITVRGSGTDATGAAIGSGISLVTAAHMHSIFEYDAKQKLVRLQPGATVASLRSALGLYGTSVMSLAGSHQLGTVGGAIASAAAGPYAGKYGAIDRAIDQLEVVLANGDVMQTGLLNKKEFERRKGLQGFEGDIYRGIDAVIEEYADVLDTIKANDATGYNGVADVRQPGGGFDLTPLFVGSQGTLGIITEIIMRAEFRGTHYSAAALTFTTGEAARDALDELAGMSPAFIEYVDAQLFDNAATLGRTYGFYGQALEKIEPAAVVLVGFDDFNDKARARQIKKITKLYGDAEGTVLVTGDGAAAEELIAALDVAYYTIMPNDDDLAAPAIYQGFHVPAARLEDFTKALAELAAKEHIALPLSGHIVTGTYSVYPSLALKKVGDKQKIFKLLESLSKLVYAHGGTMISEGGEGRLKTRSVHSQTNERLVEMYAAIRKVCDPLGTLNPGVKQPVEIKTLAGMLRDSHDSGQFARFGL